MYWVPEGYDPEVERILRARQGASGAVSGGTSASASAPGPGSGSVHSYPPSTEPTLRGQSMQEPEEEQEAFDDGLTDAEFEAAERATRDGRLDMKTRADAAMLMIFGKRGH
ncbi:hypothetical protein CVT26_007792 [Gymnopilus dilepis]|uniref:Uncharacterized protein n=1 Tax=Gymnopilus dilepis TaxID=231916 RepID=A0A409YK31_9AGAR|nr:hypothetical protein CVT26_007792 [Gymnopilus dilepis]